MNPLIFKSSSKASISLYFSLQPFVTEIDLKNALLPQATIEYLREAMPVSDEDGKEYDYERWLDYVFTESQ